MATGRVPTTANSPLTAKGDLFGYSTTQARVPVGADGETIVADSSTSTGLRYQGNYAAGKNQVINGAFDVWQRGTSFTVTGTESVVYKADRWSIQADGSTTTRTISRQAFTPGTAPVAGYEGNYFLRYAQTTAGNNSYNFLTTRLENVTTYAGQTVTLSFWAKADAARTVSTNIVQNFGSGGSGSVSSTAQNNSLTTSWQRFTYTVTLASISGKTIGTSSFVELTFQLPSGAITPTIDIWGVQFEASNVATAFQTATGTIQGELAACQRYYFKHPATGANSPINTGSYYTSTNVGTIVPFPVPMRVAPTFSVASGTDFYQAVRNGGLDGFNSFTQDSSNALASILYNNSEASGTAGHAALVIANNASASIAWSAEL
jgi:hypothetical protein